MARTLDLGLLFQARRRSFEQSFLRCASLYVLADNGSGIYITDKIHTLGRDIDFLQRLRDHALAIFLGGAAINATPKLIRPVIGCITGLLCEFLFKRALKKCMPVVKERLEKTAMLRSDPSYSWSPPVSFILYMDLDIFIVYRENPEFNIGVIYRKTVFNGLLKNLLLVKIPINCYLRSFANAFS